MKKNPLRLKLFDPGPCRKRLFLIRNEDIKAFQTLYKNGWIEFIMIGAKMFHLSPRQFKKIIDYGTGSRFDVS